MIYLMFYLEFVVQKRHVNREIATSSKQSKPVLIEGNIFYYVVNGVLIR